MNLPPGLALVALTGVLTAVPAAWAVTSNRLVGQQGQARRAAGLCAGALTIYGAATLLALLRTLQWDAGWSDRLGSRMALGGLLGLPASIASLLLVAALLEVADRVVGASARLRLMLESLTVASGLFIPVWVLVLRPHKSGTLQASCVPVVMATALAAAVVGLSVVLVVRSRVRRGPLARQALGAALIALGATVVSAGACYGSVFVMILGALLVPAGAALWLLGPAPVERASNAESISPSSGLATALAPVIAISVVAVLGYTQGGGIEIVTALVGISNGFFLVGRQYLAFLDVRRANDRLAESESHFRELAHTDPLTGLANRRGLLRTLYVAATGGAPCVLLTLDLDGFKNVNDMRGHDVGDTVLIEVGQRLRLNLRPGDLAARLGGDEFAVLLWGRPAEATKVAHRLLEVLERPYQQDATNIFLSASIGLAGCATANDIHTLLRNADLALRAAKQRGKNRVELYDATYDRTMRRRSVIEHELRGAIERHELSLAYQPVVSLPSLRPVGAEALLRWTHPELGPVSPAEFIPIAEETGQIEALGAWVLQQACRQLSRWVADGHDVWVSVNISPRELHSTRYVTRLKEVLRAHRVPPARLVLEVTEHAVATDMAEFRRTLAALRSTGVRIALDDFGAGYSSLSQLRGLPVDILKIDQALVTDQPTDHGPGAPMVDVVVRLGQRLGLQVIAEGMCEQHHLRLVEATGCHYGQGQLFGMGVPADHLEAMLVAMPPAGPAQPPLNALPNGHLIAAQKGQVTATQNGHAPATQNGHAPATQKGHLPATQNGQVTAAHGRRDITVPTSGSS